jgi:hypothetical protein
MFCPMIKLFWQQITVLLEETLEISIELNITDQYLTQILKNLYWDYSLHIIVYYNYTLYQNAVF